MNELSITMRGVPSGYVDITVDGAPVEFKKNEFGSFITSYSTEKDEVEISVRKYNILCGPLWLLFSLLFFVISFFGIFDCRNDKLCIVCDVKLRVKVSGQKKLMLSFNSPMPKSDGSGFGGEAVKLETDCEYDTDANEYFTDTVAKKRFKIMRLIKILFWVAAVVITALCVYMYVINH